MQRDFIPVVDLAQLTGRSVKTLYNEHSTKRGPLAPILTKFGDRLGAWRADYDALVRSQRRLDDRAA